MSSTSKIVTPEEKEFKDNWKRIFASNDHPCCWGLDDCSSLELSLCKHTSTCGGKESTDWYNKASEEWKAYLKSRKK